MCESRGDSCDFRRLAAFPAIPPVNRGDFPRLSIYANLPFRRVPLASESHILLPIISIIR